MITTNSNVNVPSWTFTKTEDGLYTIYNAETRSYLTSSINDTHYNIGLTTTLPNDSSGKWDVSVSGSGYKLVSGFHVYFEYYQSSFCGYKNLPGVPVYFYSK